MITSTTQPVFSMPVTAALDAKAGSNCMMDGIADEFSRRWPLRVGLGFRVAEQQSKLRTDSSKVGRGGKRKVQLKAIRQKKNSINACADRQIEQVNGPKLLSEMTRPVLEDVTYSNSFRHSKRQVEIRPPVALVKCKRPRVDLMLRASAHPHARSHGN